MENILKYKFLPIIFFFVFGTYKLNSCINTHEPKIQEISDDVIFQKKDLNTTHLKKIIENYTKIFATTKDIDKNDLSVYDSAALLYVALLYAFDTQNKDLILSFDKLFTYKNLLNIKNAKVVDDLSKRTFYFTVLEYLRRKGVKKNSETFNMYKDLRLEILLNWNHKYANIWDAEKYRSYGVKKRLDIILDQKNNGNMSYYNAITDFELYQLASGVSLALIEINMQGNASTEMAEISNYFFDTLKKMVVFYPDNTWLLQPNVWKDHPDYKDVKLKKAQSVNWDTSHFSRMPAYLNLLKIYNKKNIQNSNYITKLISGLSRQFTTKVAIFDKNNGVYAFTNFIDGNNSVFRRDLTKGRKGFDAYEDTSHVFYGWWKLLNTEDIKLMYERIDKKFNFYADQSIYVDYNRKFFSEVVKLK